jgi:hypothetical protein
MMMRFLFRCAVLFGISVVVFLIMQLLFGRSHCFDCGARYGFPFSYMYEGTYSTHGHVIWIGFLGDFAIAITVSLFAIWVWRQKFHPN